MSNSIEIITEVNRILRKKGFNRKDVENFYNEVLILAKNKKDKVKPVSHISETPIDKVNALTSIEPKNLIQYLIKRLKGRGYLIEKSPTSGSNTYYFRSDVLGQRVIRISNHNLHENQIKESQIDIVIQPDKTVKINNIELIGKFANYKAAIADNLLELLPIIKK